MASTQGSSSKTTERALSSASKQTPHCFIDLNDSPRRRLTEEDELRDEPFLLEELEMSETEYQRRKFDKHISGLRISEVAAIRSFASPTGS